MSVFYKCSTRPNSRSFFTVYSLNNYWVFLSSNPTLLNISLAVTFTLLCCPTVEVFSQPSFNPLFYPSLCFFRRQIRQWVREGGGGGSRCYSAGVTTKTMDIRVQSEGPTTAADNNNRHQPHWSCESSPLTAESERTKNKKEAERKDGGGGGGAEGGRRDSLLDLWPAEMGLGHRPEYNLPRGRRNNSKSHI